MIRNYMLPGAMILALVAAQAGASPTIQVRVAPNPVDDLMECLGVSKFGSTQNYVEIDQYFGGPRDGFGWDESWGTAAYYDFLWDELDWDGYPKAVYYEITGRDGHMTCDDTMVSCPELPDAYVGYRYSQELLDRVRQGNTSALPPPPECS